MVLKSNELIVLDKIAIAERIPHAGEMVLLDSCVSSNSSSLTCTTSSHTDKTNPLRTEKGLLASCGIEYAAQAVALHLALLNNNKSGQGLLVGCKNVVCKVRYLDLIDSEMSIKVKHIAGSELLGMLQYSFLLTATSDEQELLTGELSILITKEGHK